MKQASHFVFNHSQVMHLVKPHWENNSIFIRFILCYFYADIFVIDSYLVRTSRDYGQEYTVIFLFKLKTNQK